MHFLQYKDASFYFVPVLSDLTNSFTFVYQSFFDICFEISAFNLDTTEVNARLCRHQVIPPGIHSSAQQNGVHRHVEGFKVV